LRCVLPKSALGFYPELLPTPSSYLAEPVSHLPGPLASLFSRQSAQLASP
jgi:hypothetical protein